MSHKITIEILPWGVCKCGAKATIKAKVGVRKNVWSKPKLFCADCYNKYLDKIETTNRKNENE